MRGGCSERPESALHYAASSFQHPHVGAASRMAPTGICCTAADDHHGQHHDDRGGAGHTHHGGRWRVHAPASFGRAFSISLITALVGGPGVYGCFGMSSGRLQETGGRVGRPSGSPWLAENGGAGRACCGSSGYPVLVPYGAKKWLCGRSWRLALTFVNLGCIRLVS